MKQIPGWISILDCPQWAILVPSEKEGRMITNEICDAVIEEIVESTLYLLSRVSRSEELLPMCKVEGNGGGVRKGLQSCRSP